MSKPKIYASCKAGCLWETVHYSDFLASGGLSPITNTSNIFYLVDETVNLLEENPYYDSNIKYRITDGTVADGSDWNITLGVTLLLDGEGTAYEALELPTRSKWEHDIEFVLKSIYFEGYFVYVAYSINGEDGLVTFDMNDEATSASVRIEVNNIQAVTNEVKGYDKTAVYRLSTGEGLIIEAEETVTDEQVLAAVADYLAENPIEVDTSMTDTEAGKKYGLTVVNGKLTLTELTE